MGASGQRGYISLSHDPETDNDNAIRKINHKAPSRVDVDRKYKWTCRDLIFDPLIPTLV